MTSRNRSSGQFLFRAVGAGVDGDEQPLAGHFPGDGFGEPFLLLAGPGFEAVSSAPVRAEAADQGQVGVPLVEGRGEILVDGIVVEGARPQRVAPRQAGNAQGPEEPPHADRPPGRVEAHQVHREAVAAAADFPDQGDDLSHARGGIDAGGWNVPGVQRFDRVDVGAAQGRALGFFAGEQIQGSGGVGAAERPDGRDGKGEIAHARDLNGQDAGPRQRQRAVFGGSSEGIEERPLEERHPFPGAGSDSHGSLSPCRWLDASMSPVSSLGVRPG
jgi:hypothetical protein